MDAIVRDKHTRLLSKHSTRICSCTCSYAHAHAHAHARVLRFHVSDMMCVMFLFVNSETVALHGSNQLVPKIEAGKKKHAAL